jgi:hypothetical protein
MIVVYSLGDSGMGAHSAIAFTSRRSGPRFYSYVETAGSKAWFPKYFKSNFGNWGTISARVVIPTKNDGNPSLKIDENLVPEGIKHGWPANCATHVAKWLAMCGAGDYDDSQWLQYFLYPDSVTIHAATIREAALKATGGRTNWPVVKPALKTFFADDPHAWDKTLGYWRTDTYTAPGEEFRAQPVEQAQRPTPPPMSSLVSGLRWG